MAPHDLGLSVVHAGSQRWRAEGWISSLADKGVPLPGQRPLSHAWNQRWRAEAWISSHSSHGSSVNQRWRAGGLSSSLAVQCLPLDWQPSVVYAGSQRWRAFFLEGVGGIQGCCPVATLSSSLPVRDIHQTGKHKGQTYSNIWSHGTSFVVICFVLFLLLFTIKPFHFWCTNTHQNTGAE